MSEPRKWEYASSEVVFLTKDHPEANGRKPIAGEAEYTASFTLDDGRILRVRMGQAGFDTTTDLLMKMLTKAPNEDDGSVGDSTP